MQQGLYGVLLALILDAMAPAEGSVNRDAAAAGYQTFKVGLQSPKLGHMLPLALQSLSATEKNRLREGLKVAETYSSAGSRLVSPVKPTINFAAFTQK
jgi:hypothetical protein